VENFVSLSSSPYNWIVANKKQWSRAKVAHYCCHCPLCIEWCCNNKRKWQCNISRIVILFVIELHCNKTKNNDNALKQHILLLLLLFALSGSLTQKKWRHKKNTQKKGEEAYLQGPCLYMLYKLLALSSPLHTFESPPFFRFLMLWKFKAFKAKP